MHYEHLLRSVFRVNINHFLDLIVTAEEDTRSVVDVLGHDCQHPLHLAIDGLTTSCDLLAMG